MKNGLCRSEKKLTIPNKKEGQSSASFGTKLVKQPKVAAHCEQNAGHSELVSESITIFHADAESKRPRKRVRVQHDGTLSLRGAQRRINPKITVLCRPRPSRFQEFSRRFQHDSDCIDRANIQARCIFSLCPILAFQDSSRRLFGDIHLPF